MITEKRKFGNAGEELAVRYLLEKGYSLLGRNVQQSHHEVDIVMRDGKTLVFVEVKTRRTDVFCDPMRAVDDEKLWNLLEAAKLYRHEHPECYGLDFRIDVVCVVGRVPAIGSGEAGISSNSSDSSISSGTRENRSYKLEYYENPFWKRIQEGKPWRTHYRRMRQGHYGYYRVGR